MTPLLAILAGWCAEGFEMATSIDLARNLVEGALGEGHAIVSPVHVDCEEGPLALALIDTLRERETRAHLKAHYDQLAAALTDRGGSLVVAQAVVER